MISPGAVIVIIVAVGILFVVLPVIAYTFTRYRAPRILACPETGEQARLGIDATSAALTSAWGRPRLRVKWCTLRPVWDTCAQSCLQLPEIEGAGGGSGTPDNPTVSVAAGPPGRGNDPSRDF